MVRRTWAPRGQTPLLAQAGRSHAKMSSVAELAISPGRRRLSLYCRFFANRTIRAPGLASFVRHLLRHLRGRVILVWDRGTTHRGRVLREVLQRHRRRLSVELLPPYAPELNPTEHVWALLKHHRLPNHGCRSAGELHGRVARHTRALAQQQDLLWGYIRATDLTLKRH